MRRPPAWFLYLQPRLFWCGVSLLAIAFASMFVTIAWSNSAIRLTVRLGGGMVQLHKGYPSAFAPTWPSGLDAQANVEVAFWPRQEGWAGMGPAPFFTEVPLWFPALFLLTPALLLRDRHQTGLCCACNYDLAGNTSGLCPECGATSQ